MRTGPRIPKLSRDLRTRVLGPIPAVQFVAGIFVVGIVVIGDTLADAAIRSAGEPSISIAGDLLRIVPSANAGISFGLLRGVDPMAVSLLTGLVLAIAVASARRAHGFLFQAAIWLVLAGGVANLIERVVHGRVLDYVDVGLGGTRWPTFNLADVAISLGFIAVVVGIATARHPRGVDGAEGPQRS